MSLALALWQEKPQARIFPASFAFVNTSRTSVSLERRADVTLSLQDGVDRMIDQLRVAEAVLVADADTVVVLVEGARVTFQFNSANRTLERDGVTLGRNIESLSFEYLDAGGSPAASLDSIRRIDVHIQAKLGEEDWELATSVNLRKLHG